MGNGRPMKALRVIEGTVKDEDISISRYQQRRAARNNEKASHGYVNQSQARMVRRWSFWSGFLWVRLYHILHVHISVMQSGRWCSEDDETQSKKQQEGVRSFDLPTHLFH